MAGHRPSLIGKVSDVLNLFSKDRLPADQSGGVYAIGNFDGVHRGHQALFETVQSIANANGRPSGVMTFEPHPRQVFQPDQPHFRLTPLSEKLRQFKALGLDIAAVVDFDRDLAQLSPAQFVEQRIVEWLKASHVVVGFHFHFGAKRAGTVDKLEALGRERGFGVTVIEAQAEAGQVFSSSDIRRSISDGDVRGASRALGRFWSVEGVVEKGFQLGTDLGFPTANIALPDGTTLAHGIYAVRVWIGDKRHLGAAYYGGRPTVNTGAARLEVFLMDFDGDLYGETLTVEFVEHLRGDKAFESLDELKAQIAKDCEAARVVLDGLEVG
ncbi:MAG: bifunctional riboflavin kinase/FAD synthetase [Pseudomonadota bacterium]